MPDFVIYIFRSKEKYIFFKVEKIQPGRLKMLTKRYRNIHYINLTLSVSVSLNKAKHNYFFAYFNNNLWAALALVI